MVQVKIWFQNRRTKWKKQENLSNAEAAEHRACAEHRRSSDHRRRASVDDTSHHHSSTTIINSPPPSLPAPVCNPLTVALHPGGASPAALQFPRVYVSCPPVTSLTAHDVTFRLPPPDAIPPPAPAVTSFRPSPLLPVSRCDDVTTQRPRETTANATPDQLADESAEGYHDSDVIPPLPPQKVTTNVDNVGRDCSMRETDETE